MPELPEVETVLRGLKKRVLGRWIGEVEVRHPQVIGGPPDEFAYEVSGRRILRAKRKGKAISIELGPRRNDEVEQPRYLLVRLGMTGQFTVSPVAEPLEPHTHVRLALDGGKEELRYVDARRFGRLRCLLREELEKILGGMGPDAPKITEHEFQRSLQGRSSPIKSWLMNQQFLSGVGNIYADESLYLARLHPLMEAGRISTGQSRRLLQALKRVLDHAVKLQGTSFRDYVDIEGRPGNFLPRLRVYQRTGKPCRRCRRAIERVIISGRSSHFCPQCQPRPRRRNKKRRASSRRQV